MNVYFSGIGGVGIGPLAEIAHDAGYSVTGSDMQESVITKELNHKGVLTSTNQDGQFLKECHNKNPINWFVYTSALPDNHPELMLAKELGIHTSKRDEILAHLIDEKNLKLIAVSGTHGKTTTTGMLIWTFIKLGIPISYSIGTTITFGESGKYDPDSKFFVYECDEYDRNFLFFQPYLSLIPAIDYDHPDVYPKQQDYLDAFHQFAKQSRQVIAWDDQFAEIYNDLKNTKLLNQSNVNQNITLAGLHNRRNASLVIAAIKAIGIQEDIEEIINSFPGTNRRFEKLANNLYTDYAHHPTEIAATLQLASELSDHIVAVYQPHQNIRQHEIRSQYTTQFEKAEEIYWLPTYLSREDPNLPILKPADLIQNLTNKESVKIVEFSDELWDTIDQKRSEGKLVIFMGAGTIDNWLREKNS